MDWFVGMDQPPEETISGMVIGEATATAQDIVLVGKGGLHRCFGGGC